MNLKSTTAKGFNFQIINSLKESWGYATWLDCNSLSSEIQNASSIAVLNSKLKSFFFELV